MAISNPPSRASTDAAHLDRTPRMQFVDVVDAEASNRASLLFELRGQNARQFAPLPRHRHHTRSRSSSLAPPNKRRLLSPMPPRAKTAADILSLAPNRRKPTHHSLSATTLLCPLNRIGLRGKTLLAFAIIYFVWGSTFLAIRIGVHEVPPFLFAALRFFIAGLALYVWAIARGEGAPTRNNGPP